MYGLVLCMCPLNRSCKGFVTIRGKFHYVFPCEWFFAFLIHDFFPERSQILSLTVRKSIRRSVQFCLPICTEILQGINAHLPQFIYLIGWRLNFSFAFCTIILVYVIFLYFLSKSKYIIVSLCNIFPFQHLIRCLIVNYLYFQV